MEDLNLESQQKVIKQNKDPFDVISPARYRELFGLIKEGDIYKVEGGENGKKLVEEAYKRAWQNRDFEIDKFWSRAAYFWAFIALIFGAYFSVFTIDKEKFGSGNLQELVLVTLNCMGILFSIAWYFVIVGCKHWQENWEHHIDMLENYISGPIYKMIYYNGSFYSVSKINKVLSYIVISVWVEILIVYLYEKVCLPWSENANSSPNLSIIIPITGMCIFLFIMVKEARKASPIKVEGFVKWHDREKEDKQPNP